MKEEGRISKYLWCWGKTRERAGRTGRAGKQMTNKARKEEEKRGSMRKRKRENKVKVISKERLRESDWLKESSKFDANKLVAKTVRQKQVWESREIIKQRTRLGEKDFR